jgi:hypothetical protein
MQSVQESKQELEAAIRYAENAISSAQGTIESMEFRQEMAQKNYQEQTGREEALTKQVQELESKVQGQYDDIVMLEREVANLKECLKIETAALERIREDIPTMPVIPKAVAIAIFREGVAHGVANACDEIDNDAGISIEESEYVGGFEVSFSRHIDLSDHLDLDWMRDKVGDYDEASVIEALKNLCADKEFECRIHGVDDQEQKVN